MSIRWDINDFGYVCGATTTGKWPKSIKIPASIGEQPVVGIGKFLFTDNSSIRSVEIPASVRKIDTGAFEHCHGLQTVNFEENSQLETIGGSAFLDCSLTAFPFEKLTKLKRLCYKAFSENPYLTKVDLYNTNIEVIEEECFSFTNLVEIKLSNKLHSIGVLSFASTKLKKIDFSKYIGMADIHIYKCAFKECKELEEIIFSDIDTYLDEEVFYNCPALKKLVIPANVSLGEYSFGQCHNLKTVVLESGTPLTDTFPVGAFGYCTSLENVQMDTEFTIIGRDAFRDCSSLKTIIFPETLAEIKHRAFACCSSITAVDLTNRNIVKIESGSFSMTNFKIDDFKLDFTSATEFEEDVFRGNSHFSHKALLEKYPFCFIPE